VDGPLRSIVNARIKTALDDLRAGECPEAPPPPKPEPLPPPPKEPKDFPEGMIDFKASRAVKYAREAVTIVAPHRVSSLNRLIEKYLPNGTFVWRTKDSDSDLDSEPNSDRNSDPNSGFFSGLFGSGPVSARETMAKFRETLLEVSGSGFVETGASERGPADPGLALDLAAARETYLLKGPLLTLKLQIN
jgi:hypothetical protein